MNIHYNEVVHVYVRITCNKNVTIKKFSLLKKIRYMFNLYIATLEWNTYSDQKDGFFLK